MSSDVDPAEKLFQIVRWYDVVIVGTVFLLVLVGFTVTGATNRESVFNALAVSLLVCGAVYLVVGLFESTFAWMHAEVVEAMKRLQAE